ncbi:M23 family metallopeptidase [Celeribacter sp.]|uniref:M23 family metallopeptidase n=1 Tax=Celeribacter sp. TaxID=1890673 RepID=UPI003A93F5B9
MPHASFHCRYTALLTALAVTALPHTARAKPPLLNPPVECTLGETCYIQHFVDTDPSHGFADFTCGTLSYDGAKGTSFGLPDRAAMRAGVDVRPAAPGTVRALRDGEPDRPFDPNMADEIKGRECGNGVVIDHGDGWTTQYCHLAKGSISVQKGQRVGMASPIGQVGKSGKSNYPHLNFILRKDGEVVDPFNPDGIIACDDIRKLGGSLWQAPMVYQPGGLIGLGVSDAVPEYETVKDGTAGRATLPASAPALVVFALAFGTQEGDELRLSISGPEGEITYREFTLEKQQDLTYRATGMRGENWPVGSYSAIAQMRRKGKTIDTELIRFDVAP